MPLQRILKKRPLGQMVPICPDQGQLATSSKDPGWLSQIVTESKLILLATRQANESKRRGVEARKMTLFGKPADRKDGRLAPQNNHLIWVWMPGSFIDQRERSNEELKSKGRIESEKQWGRGVLIWSIHRWARTNSLSLS